MCHAAILPPSILQVLLGWIIISQQQDDEYDTFFDVGELDEALTHFNEAIDHDTNDLQVGGGRDAPALARSRRRQVRWAAHRPANAGSEALSRCCQPAGQLAFFVNTEL